jgi:endonuclease III
MKIQGYAETLTQRLGGRYSRDLGIDLAGGRPGEIFKWFLAAILFGGRISERLAARTYGEFERHGVTTPKAIIETGWDGLVELLDAGGYARYDFKTATKLLAVMEALEALYGGDLNALHAAARDPRDLETRLMALGKGIGPVTVNIFLRELRGLWPKADPLPSALVLLAAGNLGLTSTQDPQVALADLKRAIPPERFADNEAALLRLGKDYCRSNRHDVCPVKECCEAVA